MGVVTWKVPVWRVPEASRCRPGGHLGATGRLTLSSSIHRYQVIFLVFSARAAPPAVAFYETFQVSRACPAARVPNWYVRISAYAALLACYDISMIMCMQHA